VQRSITLTSLPSNFSWSGLATDGSILYLDEATSGRIYEYSMSGVQLGSFPSRVLNTLIGLSYDASNHSLWITNSSFNGPSQVIDLSTTGTQLSQFSTGSNDPYGGIAVVPVHTPEPDSLGLLLLPAAIALAAGIRRRR
jgi:MYXO-CTERM domain-containing protein